MNYAVPVSALFATLLSCGETSEHIPTSLPVKEQYDVITQGYSDYLASRERPLELFYKFATLEDTAYLDALLYELNLGPRCSYEPPYYPPFEPITYEASIDSQLLSDYTLFDQAETDSLTAIWNYDHRVHPVYAITRPYQPDTCNLVVLEEFEIPWAQGCVPERKRILVFEFKQGKWVFRFRF